MKINPILTSVAFSPAFCYHNCVVLEVMDRPYEIPDFTEDVSETRNPHENVVKLNDQVKVIETAVTYITYKQFKIVVSNSYLHVLLMTPRVTLLIWFLLKILGFFPRNIQKMIHAMQSSFELT